MNLMIFGSCVSRDALEYDENNSINLLDYYSRSSMVSLFSAPSVDHSLLQRIEPGFRRRMVLADMDKSARKSISRSDVDLLLLDFIDERFALHAINGGYRTISSEYKKACNGRYKGGVVRAFTEEKLALWKPSFDSLVTTVGVTPLRINRVFWRARLAENAVMDGVTEDDVERANAHLTAMYDYAAKVCGDHCFIDYDPALFFCDADHKWGIAPFHYNEAFYRQTVTSLVSLKEKISAVR